MKKKNWLIIGAIILIAVIIVIAGIIISGREQQVTGVLNKHYKYNDCVYWKVWGVQLIELPDGFQEAGTITAHGGANEVDELENGESSFGEIGHKIYANETNPYSTFLYSEGSKEYELFISQELKYDYVMVGGKLYCNKDYRDNESYDQPWEHGECAYMGTVQEVIEYEIPDKDFQSNMARAENGGIYMSETEDVVYVIRKENGDKKVYVKMLPVEGVE